MTTVGTDGVNLMLDPGAKIISQSQWDQMNKVAC
jgi:hypothetical protein